MESDVDEVQKRRKIVILTLEPKMVSRREEGEKKEHNVRMFNTEYVGFQILSHLLHILPGI